MTMLARLNGLALSGLLSLGALVPLASPALGEVVSEAIVFTPFRADPADGDWVQAVPGRVSIQLNGVRLPEQVIEAGDRELLTQREPDLRLWGEVRINTHQHESVLRPTGNVLVLRFAPNPGEAGYRSDFGWRTIADVVRTDETADGRVVSTNFAAPYVRSRP
jgi:hypothetical protein